MKKYYLRIAFSIISGVLCALPHVYFNLSPIVWFSYIPLIMVIYFSTTREAVFFSALFSFSFFGVSLFWLKVYHPLALPFMVLFFSMFTIAPSAASVLLYRKFRLNMFVLFPVLYMIFEYLRSTGYWGFPWVLTGYTQWNNEYLLQSVRFFGVYGLSAFVLTFNSLLAYSFLEGRVILFVVVVALLFGFKIFHYAGIEEKRVFTETAVSMVQPNADTYRNWYAYKKELLDYIGAATKKLLASGAGLVIWPEGVFLDGIDKNRDFLKELFGDTGAGGYILLGANNYKSDTGKIYNSVYLAGANDSSDDIYSKIHLVPFGEDVPLERQLPILKREIEKLGGGGFRRGKEYKVFNKPGLPPFSVMICYEGAFPGIARRFVKNGATFLINITNDYWTLSRTAHRQHALILTFRALENDIWIARCGNSGISGIINGRGSFVSYLEPFEKGELKGVVKCKAPGGLTFYTKYGDIFVYFLMALAALYMIYGLFGRLKP